MKREPMWHAASTELRCIRQIGMLTAIYHRRSGITHLVSDPVPQLLDAMNEIGPAPLSRISAHMQTRFDLETEDGTDPARILADRLDELAALGLVTCLPA